MRLANYLLRSTCITLLLALLAAAGSVSAQTATAIGVTSNNLFFAHQSGSATLPTAQTVRVVTVPSPATFTAAITHTAGQPTGWLLVNNQTNNITGTTGAASQDLTLAVNPASLTAGTYTAQVLVVSGTATAPISVTLTVSPAAQLRTNPGTLNVTIEPGRQTAQSVNVTNPGTAPVTFGISVQSPPELGAWITPADQFMTLIGGETKAVTLIMNPGNFSAGFLAIGTLNLNPISPAGTAQVTVPLLVTVGSPSTILVTPTTITFPYQLGFAAPSTSRRVNVTSSNTTSSVPYTATANAGTGGNWLSLAQVPGQTGSTVVQNVTPNPFYALVNPSVVGNTPGEYTATITVVGGQSTHTVNVRLVVSTTPQLTSSEDGANFVYSLGGTLPTSQVVTISTTNQQTFAFTTTPTTASGGDWLTASPQSGAGTFNQVIIGINQTRLTQLAAGTYAGTVRVAATVGTTPQTLDLPVTLTVGGTSLLVVDPATLTFEGALGQSAGAARTLSVRSSDNSSVPFTITIEPANTGWILLGQTSGTAGPVPTNITVSVNPTAVTQAGTYEATLLFTPSTPAGATPFRVPVRYVVTGTVSLTVSPERIEVTQLGTTPPASQTVTIRSNASGLRFLANSNQPWVTVSPTEGPVSDNSGLLVAFNSASLAARAEPYEAAITIQAGGITRVVPVILRVGAAATLNVTPATLTFAAVQGQPAPANQTLNVSSSGAAISFNVTHTVSSGPASWLTIAPTSGTTGASGTAPTPLVVSVNATGLAPGSYQGVITITPTTAGVAPRTVNLTLTVTAPAIPSGITITNAATGQSRGVAPGEIVTIKGRNMAPATAATAIITNGVVQSTVQGVRVTFNGTPAPLLYVGPSGDRQGDQINAIVPYGVGSLTTANLIVEYNGVRSDAVQVRVVETDPGIFTANSAGTGQGSILNENNVPNTPNTPAARGSIIQIYATGEGAVVPAGQDGLVINQTSDLRRPLGMVSVRIGGQPAELLYAGSAPTLVSGVIQVNARIPANLPVTGVSNVPVEITVGSTASQSGVTVAVRP